MTGGTLEVRAPSVREFFVWSGLSGNNSVQALEVDGPTEFINPFFSQRTSGVGETRTRWQNYSSLRFLKDEEKTNDSESSISEKRKQTLPSLLRRPFPTVDWTALTADLCQVDGKLAAVLSLITFETGTVRSKN